MAVRPLQVLDLRHGEDVVDPDHRVFGVPNLYVVDGSTLPTQGAANPALTIMALAARAADRLIRAGAPSRAAWGVALGLTVTLVWLYIEILRLLSYFNSD